jgi:hypothetical protein
LIKFEAVELKDWKVQLVSRINFRLVKKAADDLREFIVIVIIKMTSRTVRRRLRHGDVDGKKHEHLMSSDLDGLNEPLLGNSNNNNGYDDDNHSKGVILESILNDEQRKEQHHWTLLFSQLIAEWAQWFANIILASGSLIGRVFPFSLATHIQNRQVRSIRPSPLNPLQEARLKNLKKRLEVPFDGSRLEHQDALNQLWGLAFPGRELPSLKSELWKEMGWQGPDPSTDFRGGGFISLENLIFFAKTYPEAFQSLLHKNDGERADWEYPFAVAGINISFMLIQMLDLQSGNPTSVAGIRFLELLNEDAMAFDNLYCVAFQMMDFQWLAKRASYMEFNEVVKSTRTQLERELLLEDISTVKDLPAYNLLRK